MRKQCPCFPLVSEDRKTEALHYQVEKTVVRTGVSVLEAQNPGSIPHTQAGQRTSHLRGVGRRKAIALESGKGFQKPGKENGRKANELVVSFAFQRDPKKGGGQEREGSEGPLPFNVDVDVEHLLCTSHYSRHLGDIHGL